MPQFLARIGTADGAVTTRTIEAADEAAVRAEVRRQGGQVFTVKAASDGKPKLALPQIPFFGRGGRRPVKVQEFLVFNQELVALLKAGLPIVHGVEVLLERQENPHFKRILADIREQLTSGVSLSEAFLSHGDVFPRLYATSLKAGERSGEVEAVLRRYLSYQKILGAVRRKVVSALVYPAVLVSLSIGLILVLLTYVIPRFTEFFSAFGGELPMLTQVVVGIAGFMQANIVALVISWITLGYLFARWKETESGKLAWNGFLLKVPILGSILHQFAISQFTRSLATLVASGNPLVPSLEISSGSISNRRVAAAVESVVPKVREGAELWKSLEVSGQFTSLTVEMIKVGEATGALEEMLTNVSEFYDEAIEASLQRLINLIEPVILVVMGGVIATILLSVYLPMFTVLSNIKT